MKKMWMRQSAAAAAGSILREQDAVFMTEQQREALQEQLYGLGQTFGLLAEMYRGQDLADKLHRNELQTDWKEQYRELRLLVSRQLYECGEILREYGGGSQREFGLDRQTRLLLERQLKQVGVSMGAARVRKRKDERLELRLVLSADSGRCVSMKLVCRQIAAAMGRGMTVQGSQPVLLGPQPRWMCFEEAWGFYVMTGAAGSAVSGNDTSGDSFSSLELPGGKHVLFLCDGMGSGGRAGLESSQITELAEQMCRCGFEASTIVRLINNALLIQGKEHPVTIDMTVFDCANGLCEMVKSGAAATFLKRTNRVEIIGADTIPAGILEENAPMEKMLQLQDGDILIMVSDGVLEELPMMEKEEALGHFCRSLNSQNPREIAAKILKYAGKAGRVRDDMTVLVAGIWKKW